MELFTTKEIAQATGLSIRQLDYWAQREIVVPSIQKASGPGTRKLYSIEDLIKLKFIQKLKSFGWSTHNIRSAIEKLKDVMNDPDPLSRAILIHGKNTIIALCKTKEGERIILDALSSSGQQVMGIVLELLIEQTLPVKRLTSDEITNYV